MSYTIVNAINEKEYKVHVFWGNALTQALKDCDYDSALKELRAGRGCHTERVFYTKAERDAYFQGIKDCEGYVNYYVYPESFGEPIWIVQGTRCRFVMRVEMPDYIIPVLIGAISAEEYIQCYGKDGEEDVANYLNWVEKELKPLLLPGEGVITSMYEQGNCENPDRSFTSCPIFGKACDVIPMLIFAFHD